ncbi:YbfB/YjiJ family MFS transporter [Paenibacillus sp. FSL P2-0136]|uniref:YbfB/YjiJ family MFS transporter n=1 Tax=Paenibacillus sp. FSL P2-0136 TaxID=2975317 RepID=UPI0030DB4EBE
MRSKYSSDSNFNSASLPSFWPFVLTGMLMIVTTTGFARMAYGLVLPYMQAGLGLSISQGGMLGTIMFLGYLASVGLSGILAVRWGSKAVLMAGGCAVVISMFGLSGSYSFIWVALFMFLAGGGSALVFTPLMSLMLGQFPDKKGIVLGMLLSGAGIGMLLSGFLVPLLTAQFPVLGWRAVWLGFGIISLVVLIAALLILRNPEIVGSVKETDKPKWLKNKALMQVAVLYFLVGIAYLVPNLYQSGYMLAEGISDRAAGLVYAIAGIFSIAGGPVWGSLSDRFGVNRMFILVWACAAAGDIIPLLNHSIPGFVLSSVLWGSSIGGLVTLIQLKAAKQVNPRYVPTAIGFISIFYAVGQMLGPGMTGWMIDHLGGYGVAYGFGAVVYGFGLVASLISGRKQKFLEQSKKIKQ